MARKQRIHLPGGTYHVMLRGNGGQQIFYSDDDRDYFECLIDEGIKRFGYRIHGYCWMPNHVHMAIQVSDVPLSKIMQNLSFRYTRFINRKEKRVGHLFQGRYKAILVDSDSYLPELIRYVHLNPIRAGIVTDLRSYSWSSYSAYLGEVETCWLTRDWVLSLFGKREQTAIIRFEKFVLSGIELLSDVDFQKGREGGRILGDDSFVNKVMSHNDEAALKKINIDELVNKVCKHFGLAKVEVLSPSRSRRCVFVRNVVSYMWVQEYRGSLKEWADLCGKDLSSFSRNLAGFRELLMHDDGLKQEVLGIMQ